MAQLNADVETIQQNLERIRAEIDEACARVGRSPDEVTICAATKYVAPEAMGRLAEAGLTVAAENRLQDMAAKQEQFGDLFEWHFIGGIQSRKMREIAGRATTVHSLASESARNKLRDLDGPAPRLLVQVNVAGEESKQGVAPDGLAQFIADCPLPVSGLMTMPPLTDEPEAARPFFRRLRELAAENGLSELSIGTSQDYIVAVEEGATLVRLGSVLFQPTEQID